MFNPLGNFVADAALVDAAVAEALRFHGALPACADGDFDHIYDHWTVGHRNQNFSDYNGSVRFDGQHFHIDISHDPRNNARSTFDSNNYAGHTWLRNTGAFGISTDDMAGASEHDFGDEGVTLTTLEFLCAANAAVALWARIDLSGKTPASAGPYANEDPIMTHAIAAMTGGNPAPSAWYDYGITGTGERWDLATFVALPAGVSLTREMAETCEAALRQRSRLYKVGLAKRLAA